MTMVSCVQPGALMQVPGEKKETLLDNEGVCTVITNQQWLENSKDCGVFIPNRDASWRQNEWSCK